MPIPTELVGSLPRPMKLQEAYQAYDDGKITSRGCRPSRTPPPRTRSSRLEETGEPIVTDGEQRESSFATYPITDTLAGHRPRREPRRRRAVLRDLRRRPPPPAAAADRRAVPLQDVRRRSTSRRTRRSRRKPVKQAVIAPSMLMLLYPLEGEIEGYSREQFLDDLCDEVEKDIRRCFDAGAVRVSIDFTEGRLANKNDSRNPWTGKDMLQEFIDLNNRVIDRFSAEERANIGIHTCPGGDMDSVHSKEVPYEKLLSKMFQLNAGYFLIQCASEEDKESVYELFGRYSREDADGVPQVCFIGVINPLDPRGRDAGAGARRSSWRRRSTSRSSASARPTTAASRPSAATRSPSTARPTSRATSRCRRSRTGVKGDADGVRGAGRLTDIPDTSLAAASTFVRGSRARGRRVLGLGGHRPHRRGRRSPSALGPGPRRRLRERRGERVLDRRLGRGLRRGPVRGRPLQHDRLRARAPRGPARRQGRAGPPGADRPALAVRHHARGRQARRAGPRAAAERAAA